MIPATPGAYVGRFAPSPSGPLHLGSLFTALASFLDARHHGGSWLLRIDDGDTPRNVPGAAAAIMACLRAFGLEWDGEVYYQSRHAADYQTAIAALGARVYPCGCSRRELAGHGGVYPGFCRDGPGHAGPWALRLRTEDADIGFDDGLQGRIVRNPGRQDGDFVIRRKEGIVAYQLAVVVDDHLQRVNRVVRGCDLLDETPKQIYLQRLLGLAQPAYLHVPVIVDAEGRKLSKQTLAAAVDGRDAAATLYRLLTLLRQQPPASLRAAARPALLDWAVANWQPQRLAGLHSVAQPPDPQAANF